jgi:pimeloyl-ACP methyl ester carboxylesterase
MRVPPGTTSRRITTSDAGRFGRIELDVMEAGPADGPVIVLAHGFPESSWSWRHQMAPLAEAGWHVLAPDQRGYGRSSAPGDVEAYGTDELSADLLALLDDVGAEQAVFVGHDWGALLVWDLMRLHPTRARAVVGASVPFVAWPAPPLTLMREASGDNFFYIVYFQEVGPAERELGKDPRRTLASTLYAASGAAWTGAPPAPRPAGGTGFLDTMSGPPGGVIGPWCTDEDLDAYVDAFEASGFFGPVSWYRNLDADHERVKHVDPSTLTMPTTFIAGDKDMVIARDPSGIDRMQVLPGYRGHTLLPGVGHWTQQEDPAGFNAALLSFLKGL